MNVICEHGNPGRKYVAFEGISTGRRFIACATEVSFKLCLCSIPILVLGFVGTVHVLGFIVIVHVLGFIVTVHVIGFIVTEFSCRVHSY